MIREDDVPPSARKSRRRQAAAALAAVSALAWTALASIGTPGAAAVGQDSLSACGIGYRLVASGDSVHVAEVTLTNRGAPITSWNVGFTLAGGHHVVGAWNGVFHGARAIRVRNAAWNGTLAAGASTTFGYVAQHAGRAQPPADWSVNGIPCRVRPPRPTPPRPTPTKPSLSTTTPTSTTTASVEPTTTTPTTTTVAPTTTTGPASSVTTTTTTAGEPPRVDNPYDGARGYVNPEWAAKAAAEPGGERVAGYSTAIWLDRIAAIEGTPGQESYGAMGVRDHLEEALRQQAATGGGPLVIQFVLHDIPVRNCTWLSADGELGPSDLDRYRDEYVDAIAAIQAEPRYDSLRIVNLIEPHALPSMVTSLTTSRCATARDAATYIEGVRYAVSRLGKAGNSYQYVDAGHHAMLGWETNLVQGARVIASAVNEFSTGFDGFAGVVVNLGDYAATREPFLSPNGLVSGTPQRSSSWIDWNLFADEASYATAFRTAMIDQGFPEDIGVLIDTSRNGWGGPARPTAASTSSDLNTYVDASRMDRRLSAANWCNQSGAGLGERPAPAPLPGIDAFVWAKPPGESDGSSVEIPNSEGRVFTRECDPTYTGVQASSRPTGALADAPIAGAWFSLQFRQLVANAWPPVE